MKNHKNLISTSTDSRSVYYLLLILLLICTKVFSQGFPDNPTQIQEIPPSPTMWEFEKYGNYPVSMHTGVPNISIPIFNAQSGEIQVPVSLNYHASGIKVDQKASWVGLGWTLRAGGAITRTVRGSNDESLNGYINYPYSNQGSFDPATGSNYSQMEDMLQGFIDTEPDIFNYDFLGYSGKFVFNHSDSTVALIPHNDLKITPAFVGAQITSFVIVTPEGIIAEFAYPEVSSEYRKAGLIGDLTVTANSVWHLKKITAPNGTDEITFDYELVPGVSGIVIESRISESESINYDDPCSSYNYNIKTSFSDPSVVYSQVKRIKKITHNNGYILFQSSAGNRLDDPNNEDLRLDSIQIYSSLNGSDKLIKSYEMEYDYFGTIVAANPNPQDQVRLKLQKIYEVGSDGTRENPHQFSYKETGNEELPPRFSRSQDYWGYYNGKTGNASLVPEVEYEVNTGVMIFVGDANRDVDSLYAKAGILEKIVYPTLGYTAFEFESNMVTVIEQAIPNQYLVGGLRVKSISSFEADGSPQWQKSYEYVQPGNSALSSGVYNAINFIKPRDFLSASSYYFIQDNVSVGTCAIPVDPTTYQTSSVGVASSPAIAKNFASSFYSAVKEYNGSPIAHEGYKWYHYATTKDVQYQGTGPISFNIDRSWDRGQLLLEETFENGNGNPVTTVTYNYENVDAQLPVSGFKPGTRFSVQSLGFLPVENTDPYAFRSQQYFLTYYEEPITWKRLISTITVEDGVSTQNDFFYDSSLTHTNLVRTSSVGSKGQALEAKTYYPDDISSALSLEGGDLSTTAYNAIVLFKDSGANRRVGQPIQTVTINNGKKTIQRTNFKDWGANLNNTGNIISEETIQTSKGDTVSTGNLENRVLYHDYDSEGNPLEISKTDGVHVSYIWGYNRKYPIAKIENATYIEIEAYVPNLQTLSNLDIDATSENVLRNALNDLRIQLPSTMITTYTYDPLVGVTSITDPRNYTMFFTYDNFNRLKEVRDSQNNLVSDYEYHFKKQTN